MPALFEMNDKKTKLIYKTPLIEVAIVNRPNRYVAIVDLADGSRVKAHTPVGGRIGGLTLDGLKGLVSGPYENRSTLYTLEAIEVGDQWIGINQTAANSYVKSFLKAGAFNLLAPHVTEINSSQLVSPEKKLGVSRIDFFVSKKDPTGKDLWLEVKTPLIKLHATIPEDIPLKTDYKSDNVGLRMPKQMNDLFNELQNGSRAALVAVFLYENTLKTSNDLMLKDNLDLDGLLTKGKSLGLESWQITFTIDALGVELKHYSRLF